MLIKEYRICIPLSVEEYRIAQLYMIQKKSREESTGSGSAVEIIENRPYTDGPGGNGQYTFKIYHIGSHLPGWFRAILPKSALRVEEEAWNAYPYTKTRYRCPFVERFSVEIETVYRDDDGAAENVFGLPPEDRALTQVDFLDMVRDPISAGDYRREEDPKLFVSAKTGRGPLGDAWREEYGAALEAGCAEQRIMCAYKVCRVEFKYWGMQNKLERFIHDVALRKTMLRAHRQAWCWQDEWVGLTIDDIRRLEAETAEALAKKMALLIAEDDPEGTSSSAKENAAKVLLPSKTEDADAGDTATTSDASKLAPKRDSSLGAEDWRAKSFETLHAQSSSDDEFFDAHDMMDIETSSYVTCMSGSTLLRRSSLEFDEFNPLEATTRDLDDSSHTPHSPKKSVLFLVVHGGSLLDTSHEYHNKHVDISTLRNTFELVATRHYTALAGRLAIKLVAAPPVVTQTLNTINSLVPHSSNVVGHSLEGAANNDFIPLGTIPLFFSNSPEYEQLLATTASRLNQRYAEFLASEEGQNFSGPVCVVGDSVGSVLAYDILSRYQTAALGSRSSLQTVDSEQSDSDLVASGSSNRGPAETSEVARGISLSNPDLPGNGATPSSSSTLVGEEPRSSPRLSVGSPPRYGLRSPGHGTPTHHGCRLDFDVSDFFMLGSPLALLLAFRQHQVKAQTRRVEFPKTPVCHQAYNFFHSTDPCCFRVEPLLESRFSELSPIRVPRYTRYPMGDGQALSVLESLIHHHTIFMGEAAAGERKTAQRQNSVGSTSSSVDSTEFAMTFFSSMRKRWWGNKRLDYILHSPDVLQSFPIRALPHMHHASYWESTDVVSFILRQVVDLFGGDVRPSASTQQNDGLQFVPSHPREKWRNRGNSIKLKNASPNHRANDVMVLDGQPQVLSARFSYGPLDMLSLSGEMVDVHLMSQPPSGTWEYLGTEVTDSNGRAHFRIPDQHRLVAGMYPVKMVVRADHSTVDLTLAVLPPKTEAVVFSVDGSFAASVSIMGRDPKVRAGGVDVVRHWQELGYLLIYITARPDMQQRRVVGWLAEHNFPRGMVLFMSGLTAEPLRQKANCLGKLVREVDIRIHCAYGSAKDISVYRAVGLQPHQIFVVGKASKKQANACTVVSRYATHLSNLVSGHELSRRAQGSSRIIIHKACFGLPTKSASHKHSTSGAAGGKKMAKRTASCPVGATAPYDADTGPLAPPAVEVQDTTTPISKPRGLAPRLKLR